MKWLVLAVAISCGNNQDCQPCNGYSEKVYFPDGIPEYIWVCPCGLNVVEFPITDDENVCNLEVEIYRNYNCPIGGGGKKQQNP